MVVVLLLNITLIAQKTLPLTGTVTAETDESPIPGVNVLNSEYARGTFTDFDGNYQIEVKSGDVLQFSYVGFVSQTITIRQPNKYNIT